jgi:hypothetical protein
MTIMHIMAGLFLASSLATPATAQEQINNSGARTQAFGIAGREIAAPPWSAACMSDQGPSDCGQPMWVYGSTGAGLVTPMYSNAHTSIAIHPRRKHRQ